MANDVELRAYVEALLNEKDRALRMADEEREKAAAALRVQLERNIVDGDDRLRDHIMLQVAQIRLALEAADKLEIERITKVGEVQRAALTQLAEMTRERAHTLRGELAAANANAKEAVLKQEQANERRFEAANEWRQQSADRERSQADERAKLEANFMLREVADAAFAEIRANLERLNSAVIRNVGEIAGHRQAISDRHANVTTNTAILYIIIAILALAAAVATGTHGFH